MNGFDLVRKNLGDRAFHHFKLHWKSDIHRALKYLVWFTRVSDLTTPYPLQAKIEITRRCNLNCKMCMRKTLPVYPDLDNMEYSYILDALKNISVLAPHGYGEPLCHANFLEFMLMTNHKGIKIHLTTNGTLLDPDTSLSFIKECKPIRITFSVDAGTKKEYEWIRQRASFELMKHNIREACKVAKKVGTKTTIACTYGSWNKDQIVPLSRLASELGLDSITFSDLTLHGVGLATGNNKVRTDNQVMEDLRKARDLYGDSVNIGYTVNKMSLTHPRCIRPWISTFIQSNGDVFPCTDTLNYKLGNIFETDFKDIWNGGEMIKFRRRLLSSPVEECRKCPSY